MGASSNPTGLELLHLLQGELVNDATISGRHGLAHLLIDLV